MQEALGRIEGRQLRSLEIEPLAAAEFKVFSQWGEDGILQHLVQQTRPCPKVFVEFGVENYSEANTRFLLSNDNWAGLVIDGNRDNIEVIKKDNIYWRHNLKAEHAFITRENINDLIRRNGITGNIGLLSIDIDGNDYWVWEALDVVVPRIVVVEYNSRFGPERAVTVPYDSQFGRIRSHHSNIYYGASLKALWLLARKKGYAFVGCNSAGNNAFFVHREGKPEKIAELTPLEGWVQAAFREARNEIGELSFLTTEEERDILKTLPLVEIS